METEIPTEVLGLNPFEPGFYENPYDQYARLREAVAVHRSPIGPWLVTRWEDVHALLRRPGMSVEEANATGALTRREQLAALTPGRAPRKSVSILNIDPPDHTRIRGLVSRAFTPRSVERIRARAGTLVDDILDDLATREGPVDLIGELAFPLPFTVISEMLGMPDGDRDQLRAWSHTVTLFLDPLLAIAHIEEILDAMDHMKAVVSDAIEWKRGRPDDDDLLNALIHAEENGTVLSDDELVENVILLYLAGHETTVNLIGNGTAALLAHRGELERLVADPSLDANAIEELLRYDSPVQFSRRIALDDFTFGDQEIRTGDMVMTCLGSANRDPRKFGPDADRLDLARPTAREHVSFGSGVHHCLGAALARLEGQEAIGRLVRRFPDLEAAGPATMNGRMVLRGRDELPVALHPSA